MTKSLLELLPQIVAEGKREAERAIERAEGNQRLGLQTRELVTPARDSIYQDLLISRTGKSNIYNKRFNQLIYGDNLLAMSTLLIDSQSFPSMRNKIDLIYIDPPYDSKADYRSQIKILGSHYDQSPTVLEQFAYSDTWSDGTSSYIKMIVPRLYLMKELLSSNGTIFVHLDWHVGHYVKIVLDEIFGRSHFINEIIWHYYNKMQGNINHFPRNHDVLYWYRKSEGFTFTKMKEERSEKQRQLKRAWSKEKQKLVNARDKEGNLIYIESEDKGMDDVWYMPMLQPSDKTQNLGYKTQKPEVLVETIISAASKTGDIVADFFVGSGTTASVAERLDRNWVVSDLGKPACMMTRKRLIDQSAQPFLYQHIGDYQIEQMRATRGSRFRIGELAEIVLGLYGATPLPNEENPNKNMGYIQAGKTLVLADSPNKMTGLTTLRRAIEIRDNLMGGWNKVVVLGWNFSPTIGQDIEDLGQKDKLEVLVIPPDLFDRMKKKGKLKPDEVRFSSLQYLKLGDFTRHKYMKEESLTISIANYVLLSPEALNLDDSNRQKLQNIANTDSISLIEYWSVDPDYDGEIFRSVWQDYRGNTESEGGAHRVVTVARLDGLPLKEGLRRVCVRVVDVFGFEAESIVEVG